MSKHRNSASQHTDLLAVAKTVHSEYSRLRQQREDERKVTAGIHPPVTLPKFDRSGLTEYWRNIEASGTRTRCIVADLSRVNQTVHKLVPKIRSFLLLQSTLSPRANVFLDAFNQLALATVTAETLLHRPDTAVQDLGTMIEILQRCRTLDAEPKRHAASKSQGEPRQRPTRLGRELRAARLRAGHSQRQAAEKMGYDHKSISEWETGKRKPHPKTAKDIRDYIHRNSKTE